MDKSKITFINLVTSLKILQIKQNISKLAKGKEWSGFRKKPNLASEFKQFQPHKFIYRQIKQNQNQSLTNL